MDRRIYSLMLVALFAAPGVALADTPLPLPSPGTPLLETVQDVTQETVASLDCREAVQVAVTLQWGDIVERRLHTTEASQVRQINQVVELIRTPVFEVVPALGVAEVANPVSRLVGYDVEQIIEQRDRWLDVTATWAEHRWDYGDEVQLVLLTLPAGLPFLATGQGERVSICDGVELAARLPAFENPGHDYWRVCIQCDLPSDGWVRTFIGAIAVPGAEPGDEEPDCPLDILQQIRLSADRYAAGIADGVTAPPMSEDAHVTTRDAGESSADVSSVAATSALGAVLAATLALAGLVAALRRF